ncbi:MAG: hypothetical protein ABIH04_09905 [Planctomycetota bacterium]
MGYTGSLMALRKIEEFRNTALHYWAVTGRLGPETKQKALSSIDSYSNADKQNDETVSPYTPEALREKLACMVTEVEKASLYVGVSPEIGLGAPIVGYRTLNVFREVYSDRDLLPMRDIVDYINSAIGAARSLKSKYFWRRINPFCWLVDIPALVIRWPFLILRAVGISQKVEDTLAARIIKGLQVIIIYLFLLVIGLRLTLPEYFSKILQLLDSK